MCIAIKGRQIRKEEMAPADRPPALGDRWNLDGLNLPPSMGYDHLIVATDVATKYVLLSKSIGETAQAASSLLMRICHTFGRPKQMTTDQGRANISNLFMTVCHDNGIQFKPVGKKKKKRPQGNGMVERVNRTIQQIATALCEGRQDQWAENVGVIEFALNTRVNSVTKFTPLRTRVWEATTWRLRGKRETRCTNIRAIIGSKEKD